MRPARRRRADRRRKGLMTKSFLIALAGFAIGLGVTTAITFITPELTNPGPIAAKPDVTPRTARKTAAAPPAALPVVKQSLALLPKKPSTKVKPLPPAPAMPAVRQEARPTSTYSTGAAPLSSDAKTSG